MKSFELNQKFFNNSYGLSCVENLLLYVLNSNGIISPCLYYSSFLTIEQIEKILMTTSSYSTFDGIERLQDVAVKEGIINMHIMDEYSLKDIDDRFYCCSMVTPMFIRNKYRTTLMRDDHYILISSIDDNMYGYANDTPRDVGQILVGEFEKYYVGKNIVFELCEPKAALNCEKYILKMINKLKTNDPEYKIMCSDILVLRDVIGILRILRKRMYSLISLKYKVEFMIPYLNYLDKCYANIEYMRIKHKIDETKIVEMKGNIVSWDAKIVNEIANFTET